MSESPKEVHPRLLVIIVGVLEDLRIDHDQQAEFADERPLTTGILTNALSKLSRAVTRDDDAAIVRFAQRGMDQNGNASQSVPIRRGEYAAHARFEPG